ncbi:MAG TPA: LLM class flavin-dependent oxidoreductase, partial [Actinomycetes bacterium]|nr:LLM class flavin-dependent oxidoreductase [Actinomycetes bacterium]
MKLGLHYWNYSTPADPAAIAPTLAETAKVVDQAGFSTFTVMDHFFQMDHSGSAAEPMLEGYTTLGYVAAMTERVTLGVHVTGVMYRYPGLLAKTVTTLDVLSEGRARLGIGTGRIAVPLAQRGVPVHGIDISEPMVARLRGKPGAERVGVTIGDFATTTVDGSFALVYLVYNTI